MACVSFDCESGPAELIEHEVNGLLVPSQDVDGLAKAISRLMDDKALRQRLGKAAIVSAERFSLEDIANDWERLLTEIIADE
jgi:glycosyltransferase involved in cell wall biosynthesis